MASVGGGFGAIAMSSVGFTSTSSSKHFFFLSSSKLTIQSSISDHYSVSIIPKITKFRNSGRLKSVQLDVFITTGDKDDGEMSNEFLEGIEELERMARGPSDVLEEMNHKLSSREWQLLLVYFAQEGRDSWCALEVFEWLKKENRVDEETMELMVSITCTWVKKLIERSKVEDVVDLLVDMDCVGLKTSFSMIEKVIALYWEAWGKEEAVVFVEEVLRRGISCLDGGYRVWTGDNEGNRGSPAGYLAWKMMVTSNC